MTVIGQMFEEDKQKALKERTEEVTTRIAESLLRDGDSPEKVARNTGLSLEQVRELEKSILQTV